MISDAGGLPVAGGHMRTGVLLRMSGGLATRDALARLPGARTIVDLRGQAEHGSAVENWARATGTRYEAIEIDVARGGQLARIVRDTAGVEEAEAVLEALYIEIIDDYATEVGRAIAAIAEGVPAIICCTAGKDRTGITAALIQAAVGATDEAVLAAYESCAPSVDRLRPLLRRYLDEADTRLPQAEVLLGAKAPTLKAALTHVRSRYGGLEGYLDGAGVDAGTRRHLREALVRHRHEPAASGPGGPCSSCSPFDGGPAA